MNFCRLLWTLLFMALYTGLYAQSGDYRYRRDYLSKFDSYTTDDGLKGRKVLDIHQDRYGFLWIATDEGLNRFDGYDFCVFTHQPDDSTSISNSHVTSIDEDIYGNLWIGTQHGLNRFLRENETFDAILHDDFDVNTLSHNYVRELYADTSGFLWIETVDGILNRYEIQNESFVHYKHSKIKQPYYEYHAIYEDKRGDFWIGGRSMGPYRFLKNEEGFVFYRADGRDSTKKRDNDVAAYLEDSYGNFWVSGIDGIYRFFPDEKRFQKFYGTSTFDIVEDKEGYIWFATGNGVLRYDPSNKELIHYRADQDNPQSLNVDDVNCIFEDQTGNIWFGTNNGLNKYSRNKYKFSHIYHIPGNKNTIAANDITSLMTDDRDNLWIGTDGYGLDKMNLNNNTITHYKKEEDDPGSLASNYVSDIYQDRSGDIWIGLWQGIGFNKYDASGEEFILYSHNPNNLKTDWYVDFLEDHQGTFWVGLWGAQGMQEFNRNEGHFEPNHFSPLHNRPIDMKISGIAFDHLDHIYIKGIHKSALYQYHYRKDSMMLLRFRENEQVCAPSNIQQMHALSNGDLLIADRQRLMRYYPSSDRYHCYGKPSEVNTIKDIALSFNDSIVWLNTDRGFYQFTMAGETFKPVRLPGGNEKILTQAPGPSCVFIATAGHIYRYNWNGEKTEVLVAGEINFNINEVLYADSSLYVGTDEGLYCMDMNTGKKQWYRKEEGNTTSLSGNLVTELFQDKDGAIWIGTTQGINLFDPADNSFFTYKEDPYNPNGLINNSIVSLEEGKNDDIWVGTSKGLCVFNKRTGEFTSYNRADSYSLTSRLNSVIFEDSRKYLWVGTSNKGLNRMNLFTGIIDHFRYQPDDSSSISGDAVNCIFEDSGGTLWIGTDKGLNRFLGVDIGFKRYTLEDGLPDNHIMSILEDDSGNLWISTQHGLARFDYEDTVFTSFFRSDGLQGNRFTGACSKVPDGRLAFGGENGITLFHPGMIVKNTRKPKLQITAFEKFDQIIRRDFTSQNRISLEHDENFFTLHFASLDFTAPEKNQYAYMLEGVNEDWVYPKDENKASYTDIDPGTYTFKVKGSNNDYVWNDQPVSLQIRIYPPFYRTTWFLLLVIFSLGSVAFVFVRMRIQGLKKEKNNVELEQKLLRSQMNPHFIFNSLTSIQNFMLSEEVGKANHYLVKFSKLLRLILSHSRTNYISLSQEIETLEHYLTIQKIRYNQLFEYFLEVSESLDPEKVLIPPMLTQPFVENAIEHGFKLAEYPGRLYVQYAPIGQNIQIVIEDNGIGIERSKQFKATNDKDHQSLATKITRERILNLNRFRKHKIHMEIHDLGKNGDDQQGTRVDIWIPYMLKGANEGRSGNIHKE